MKTLTRLLLIPVLLSQLTYTPQAKAEMEWWQAALLGGVAGAVVTMAIMSQNDESHMEGAMRGMFRGNITVGDRVPWQGDNHRGYYVFDAEGSSRDGRYNNCRRVRPVAYDNQNREVDMRRYPPTCACQTADNRWKKIPMDQFVERRNQPAPYYTAPTYESNSPYAPFYSGRPLTTQRDRYQHQQPMYVPVQHRPQPYYPPQNDYNNGIDLGLHLGVDIQI